MTPLRPEMPLTSSIFKTDEDTMSV
jgi:hypothetical protein